MVTASPALMILAFELEAAVKTASLPGTKAPIYRPARETAVALARKLYREHEACCWQEDLRQSAELAAQTPKENRYSQKDGCWYDRNNSQRDGITKWQGD